MNGSKNTEFNAAAFLTESRVISYPVHISAKESFFNQGAPADCVYFLQSGRARLTVVSARGKEAIITLLGPGDFVGEEALSGIPSLRMATATAIATCTALKIMRPEMMRVLHDHPAVSDRFLSFLLTRFLRTQADLVDQLFNSSERRLARILLLMAEFGTTGQPEMNMLIPPITQETLAEMIGTTRSRVSFFMNRFRKLGFVEYNGRIRVHKSLLNVVLHDEWPERNEGSAQSPLTSPAPNALAARRKASVPNPQSPRRTVPKRSPSATS